MRTPAVRSAFWERVRTRGFLPGLDFSRPIRGRVTSFWEDLTTLRIEGGGGHSLRVGLRYSSAAFPRDLKKQATAMSESATRMDDPPYFVLVVPFVTDRSREILRSSGVGFIDLAGNCHLARETMRIEISGRPNPFSTDRSGVRSVFRGDRVSARALRVLLGAGTEPIRLARIAADADASLGLVHATVNRLRREGFVAGPRGDERLVDRESLLAKFAEEYEWDRVTRVDPLFTLQEPVLFRERVGVWAKRARVPLAFTLGSGVRPDEIALTGSLTAFYCASPAAVVREELQLRSVPTGANVLLLTPPAASATEKGGVFYALRGLPWGPGVSTIQMYLDLAAQKGRWGEQATELLGRARFA